MELKPGKYRYRNTTRWGDKERVSESATVIEETADGWAIRDTNEIAAATMTNLALVEKDTLHLRKLSMTGGPVRWEVDFRDGRAKGVFKVSMQEDQQIDCDTGGELFAGNRETLAALPLAEGFATRIRLFNAQKQEVSERELVVSGIESNCFAVDIGAGYWKLWVDRDTRAVVRSVVSAPNGMTISSELLPR